MTNSNDVRKTENEDLEKKDNTPIPISFNEDNKEGQDFLKARIKALSEYNSESKALETLMTTDQSNNYDEFQHKATAILKDLLFPYLAGQIVGVNPDNDPPAKAIRDVVRGQKANELKNGDSQLSVSIDDIKKYAADHFDLNLVFTNQFKTDQTVGLFAGMLGYEAKVISPQLSPDKPVRAVTSDKRDPGRCIGCISNPSAQHFSAYLGNGQIVTTSANNNDCAINAAVVTAKLILCPDYATEKNTNLDQRLTQLLSDFPESYWADQKVENALLSPAERVEEEVADSNDSSVSSETSQAFLNEVPQTLEKGYREPLEKLVQQNWLSSSFFANEAKNAIEAQLNAYQKFSKISQPSDVQAPDKWSEYVNSLETSEKTVNQLKLDAALALHLAQEELKDVSSNIIELSTSAVGAIPCGCPFK